MQCVYCGNELTANAKFCIFCGKPVPAPVKQEGVCTNCGNVIIPGNKFCIFCGAKIEHAMQQTQKVPEVKKELLCQKCGAKLYEGQKFCIVCGMPTGQQPVYTPPAPPVRPAGDPFENDTEPETTLLNEDAMETTLLSEETVLLPPRRILVVVNAENPQVRYQATIEDKVTIGRARTCDIVIGGERAISRTHCRVILKGDQLYIEDANSSNGTYHQNMRIPGGQQVPFCSGDLFRLGEREYKIELKTEQ